MLNIHSFSGSLRRFASVFLAFAIVLATAPVGGLLPVQIAKAESVTVNCSGTSGSPTAVTESDLAGDDVTFSDTGGDGYCVLDAAIDANSVVVGLGVVLTHAAEDSTGVNITTTGNLTLTGEILVTGKGCAGGAESADGRGPNTGTGVCAATTSGYGDASRGGGGHGGPGGAATAGGGTAGIKYDSPTVPTLQGSGGAGGPNGGETGGAGGGKVRLNVGGTLFVDGAIKANGNAPPVDQAAGGGSGGAIHITTGTLDTTSGTGAVIQANGGNAYSHGGAGGGGRVAVYYDTLASDGTNFALTNITATKGAKGTFGSNGEPGSTFILNRKTDDGIGDVRVITGLDLADGTDFARTNITLDSGSTITCDAQTTLNFTASSNFTDNGSTFNCTAAITTANITATDTLTTAGVNWDFTNTATVNLSAATWTSSGTNTIDVTKTGSVMDWTVTNALTLNNLTYTGATPGTSISTGGVVSMDNAIAVSLVNTDINSNVSWTGLSSLSIDADSSISANGKGCDGGPQNGNGYGPATDTEICTQTTNGYGAQPRVGAGHGGAGGRSNNSASTGATYGLSTIPIFYGSGGGGGANGGETGGAGGGKIRLDMTGTFTLNGTLSSNGSGPGDNAGGGSGGSVYVTMGTLAGSGTANSVAANGGAGIANGGGGGGGRVLLSYGTSGLSSGTIDSMMQVGGGASGGTGAAAAGSAGSTNNTDLPIFSSALYKDSDGDGDTDQAVITFDENVTIGGTVASTRFTWTSASGANGFAGTLSGNASASGTDVTITIDSAEANETGSTTVPTIAYSDNSDDATNKIQDTDGNIVQTFTAQNVSDGAKPVVITKQYQDVDANGTVERVLLTLSENASTQTAVLGDFAYVASDITGSALAGGTLAYPASNQVGLALGTAGNANITGHTTAPTLAYTDGGATAIADAAGNQLATFAAANLSDGAAPIVTTRQYEDSDANGAVDRVALTLSEAASTQTAVLGDFAYVASDITGSALSGGTLSYPSSTTVRLVLGTAGNANITGHTTAPTLAYTDGGATAIADAAGNQLATFAAANLSDGAAPIVTTRQYEDSDSNGAVDRVALTLSEAASTQTAVLGDFAYVASDITGSALSGGTLSYPSSTTVRLVLGTAGNANITGHTTAPTLAYADGGATAIADAAGNQLATYAATALTDAAAPTFVSASANSSTNVRMTLSETVSAVTFGAASAWTSTGFTSSGVAINGDTTKLDVTVSSIGVGFTSSDFAFTAGQSGSVIRDAALNETASFASKTISDGQNPGTPGSFSKDSGSGTTAVLSWTATDDTNFNHYEIWYGTNATDVTNRNGTASEWDNDPNDATLATRTTITTTLTGLTAGSTYYARLCAVDNASNEACTSNITFVTNQAPTVSTVTASEATTGTGRVSISFVMDDPDNDDTLQAQVEYSLDGGSTWNNPTLLTSGVTATYGAPTVNNAVTYQVGQSGAYVTSSGGANTITVLWDSATDSPTGNVSNARIRVTPYDGVAAGTAASSSNFVLDNVAPASLANLAKSSATFTTLVLGWTAATDTNFDHYEIWYGTTANDVTNRTGTATEWDNSDDADMATVTTADTTLSGLTEGVTYSIKIWAVDDFGNETTLSAISAATNSKATAASVTGSQATDGSGKVTASFIMDDANDSAILQAKVEYSTDNGSIWAKATLSEVSSDITATLGTPDVENDNTYQVGNSDGYVTSASGANTITVIWNSKTDVPTADTTTTKLRITPYDGIEAGTAVASSAFTIDNVAPNAPVSTLSGNAFSDWTHAYTFNVTGTKDANSSIKVGGVEKVAYGSSATWSYQDTIEQGNNTRSVVAVDAKGNESSALALTLSYTQNLALAPSGSAGGGGGGGGSNSGSSSSGSSSSGASAPSPSPSTSTSISGETETRDFSSTETPTVPPASASAVPGTAVSGEQDTSAPPVEVKPTEVKPATPSVKPVEVKPVEVKPVEVKPVEVKPVDAPIVKEVEALYPVAVTPAAVPQSTPPASSVDPRVKEQLEILKNEIKVKLDSAQQEAKAKGEAEKEELRQKALAALAVPSEPVFDEPVSAEATFEEIIPSETPPAGSVAAVPDMSKPLDLVPVKAKQEVFNEKIDVLKGKAVDQKMDVASLVELLAVYQIPADIPSIPAAVAPQAFPSASIVPVSVDTTVSPSATPMTVPATPAVTIVPETRIDLVINDHVAKVYQQETEDTDANGLPDFWEKKYLGTSASGEAKSTSSKQGLDMTTIYLLGLNPMTDDTDGDGESDVNELSRGSDPTKWDSRGDGMSDNEKTAWGLDYKKSDYDGDGFDDTVELASGTDPKDSASAPTLVNNVPEEWAAKNQINPKEYGVKMSIPQIKKEVQLSFAMVDHDGDGLTDAQELKYRTDPNRIDSDGDGVSDYDEINVYKTNPREVTRTEQIYKPRLSNVNQDSNVFGGEAPVLTGTSKPNHSVKLLIIPKEAPQLTFADRVFASLFGVEKNGAVTMEVETDSNGKFLTRPNLKDGSYTVIVRSLDDEGNVEDETVPYSLEINAELAVDLVVPEQLDQIVIDPDSLQTFTIGNSRPYFYGRVLQKNLEVHANWASELYGSAIEVDTDEGDFVMLAPQVLEPGSHELSVYGRDSARHLYTSAISLEFMVAADDLYPAPHEDGSRALLFLALVGLAAFGGFRIGVHRRLRHRIFHRIF